MPLPSQDPLPQAIDFLSQCERCHKTMGDLWFINGEYVCLDCYKNYKPTTENYNYKKVEIEITTESVHSYGKRWTKWCGENNVLFALSDEWFCQACGTQQTLELPSYLIRIRVGEQEYARICSVCLNVALASKINNLYDLMNLTRKLRPDY